MTTYKFGDIVLVGFPFTNLQTTKKRPAVVISNAEYQRQRPDVILLAITSQIRQPLSMGESILVEWQQAGLPKQSVLKPLIATVEQKRVLKRIGTLTSNDQKQLTQVIQTIIGQ